MKPDVFNYISVYVIKRIQKCIILTVFINISFSPGGVFGAICLALLCVVVVYLLVKGELKKTSFYVEVTRLYGYVPSFPLPTNVQEFLNNRLNWR